MKTKKIIIMLLTSTLLSVVALFNRSGSVRASATASKTTLLRTIKGHIWSLHFGDPMIIFATNNGTLGLGKTNSDLQYFLNKKNRYSFTLKDYWRMNGSTDIAPGNKVLAFNNKYKINKGKLSCRFHMHFKGTRGNANGSFNFDISKLRKIDSKHLQGELSYMHTTQMTIKLTNGPKVNLTKIR